MKDGSTPEAAAEKTAVTDQSKADDKTTIDVDAKQKS